MPGSGAASHKVASVDQTRADADIPSEHTELVELVGQWLSPPEVAERLGVEVRDVRALLADGTLGGVRLRPRAAAQVPARYLAVEGGRVVVLTSLRGTLTVLGDAGLSDIEATSWMFTPHEGLGAAPIDALHANRIHPVRAAAALLL